MKNQTLAIITPIRNTPKKYFIDCIHSVIQLSRRLTVPIEWVIVIDGDDRNIEQWVSSEISTIDIQYKVLRSPACIGLGAARNWGLWCQSLNCELNFPLTPIRHL